MMLKHAIKCRGVGGKVLWAVSRQLGFVVRFAFYCMFKGSYFKSIGRGTRIFGALRFGSAEGNITVGRRCMLGHGVFFSARSGCEIKIGNGCTINTGTHVVAVIGVEIGDNTLIAEYCSIRDQNHAFEDVTISVSEQGFTGAPISIGKDVWIGRGVFIGPGVCIGDGAIVGANSVVTKDVAPFMIVAGAPARPIGIRGGQRKSGLCE